VEFLDRHLGLWSLGVACWVTAHHITSQIRKMSSPRHLWFRHKLQKTQAANLEHDVLSCYNHQPTLNICHAHDGLSSQLYYSIMGLPLWACSQFLLEVLGLDTGEAACRMEFFQLALGYGPSVTPGLPGMGIEWRSRVLGSLLSQHQQLLLKS
jgi:hypothetical protein